MKNVFAQAQAAMKHLIKHSTHKHRSGKGVVTKATLPLLNFSLLRTPFRLTAILCFLLTFGVGEVLGADVTYTFSSATNNPGNSQDWYSDDIDAYSNWSATDGKSGNNTNSPKYYDIGSGLRVYNNGTFTISSTKTIASITLTFSGSSYTFSDSNTTTPLTVSPNATSYNWSVSRTCRLQKIEITYAVATPHTVTLMDSGDELEEANAGDGVELPSRAGCTGYTFAGWTKSWATAQTTWTTTAPAIISAGSYTPSANENLYPVYTKTEGGGTTYQFQKVTALSQINAGGTFIITNGSYYLPNAQATNSGPSVATMVAITNGVVTGTVTNDMKWTFSAADASNHVTIKSYVNATYYLKTNNDNNGLRVTTGSDSWTFEEYTVSSILGFAMKSTSQNRYCAVYQTSNWRTYTTKNQSNYQQNSGRLDIYKETAVSSSTTSYISVPNCCTPLGTINGSIKQHWKLHHLRRFFS